MVLQITCRCVMRSVSMTQMISRREKEEGEGEDEIDEVEAVLDTTDGDCGDEEALFVGER